MDKKYSHGEMTSLFDFMKPNTVREDKRDLVLSSNLEKRMDPLSWIIGHDYKKSDFELFEDVGQIYELQLAKMECEEYSQTLKVTYETFKSLNLTPKEYTVLLGSALNLPLDDN